MSLDLLTSPRRMTDLDAVNASLRAFGQHPVGDIDTNTNSRKAADALGRTLVRVQSEPWNFCQEHDFKLEPDEDSFITIGEDILSWELSGTDSWRRLQLRDGRLYDMDNKTFIFEAPVQVTASRALKISDLQTIPAWYIAILAAIDFVGSERPDDPVLRQLELLRVEARRNLENWDSRAAPGGLKSSSPHFARIRRR